MPAVLSYYEKFVGPLTQDVIERYLLAAGMIGSLYKMNASILVQKLAAKVKWAWHVQWLRRV